MSKKHTPGPWSAGQGSFKSWHISANTKSIAAVVGGWVFLRPEGGYAADVEAEPESEANARLIAEAPAMLEALRKLANEAAGFLSLSDIERHGMTNSRILRDRIEQARDVIRKAVGD